MLFGLIFVQMEENIPSLLRNTGEIMLVDLKIQRQETCRLSTGNLQYHYIALPGLRLKMKKSRSTKRG